jgi:hypothetical protein
LHLPRAWIGGESLYIRGTYCDKDTVLASDEGSERPMRFEYAMGVALEFRGGYDDGIHAAKYRQAAGNKS